MKQLVISKTILNFENRIIPIFTKVPNSENFIFHRALESTLSLQEDQNKNEGKQNDSEDDVPNPMRIIHCENIAEKGQLLLKLRSTCFIIHSVPRIVALIRVQANTVQCVFM
jgi:hypothetical protein